MTSLDIEAATALKQQGNKAFTHHDWPAAVDFYTQAIEKYDRDPSFFCNRAQVGRRLPGKIGKEGVMSTAGSLPPRESR
jgi:serine/threonine-protein phosphatase 5